MAPAEQQQQQPCSLVVVVFGYGDGADGGCELQWYYFRADVVQLLADKLAAAWRLLSYEFGHEGGGCGCEENSCCCFCGSCVGVLRASQGVVVDVGGPLVAAIDDDYYDASRTGRLIVPVAVSIAAAHLRQLNYRQ